MSIPVATGTLQLYRERILRVSLYIQQHLDDEISLEELARSAHFSPFHFHRIFRALTGESLGEHVRRLRLERAATRLRMSEIPILQLALEAGYDTHESFSRAFRAMFGQSPSAYRTACQPAFGPGRIRYGGSGGVPSGDDLCVPEATTIEVRIEDASPRRVVFARACGPYAEAACAAWSALCGWAGPRRLLGPHTKFIGLCHDSPDITPHERIRYDAAITVDAGVRPDGEIGVQELPGGLYAVTLHRGPHHTLYDGWTHLCERWLLRSKYQIRNGPSFEIYLNTPETTAPEDLLTDLYLPIEPAV